MNRRDAFRLMTWMTASPLLADIMETVDGPVNIHEFEAVAKKKLDPRAYDFIAGGVEDEKTLRANREAYDRVFLVPRVMVDVSNVDTSLELFGQKLDSPILIAPTGGKNLVMKDADEVVAEAAAKTNTLMIAATGPGKLIAEGSKTIWWTNTIGQPSKNVAQTHPRRVVDRGAKAITVTVDNPYQSNRDRNNRNRLDYGDMGAGLPKPGEKREPRMPAKPAMWKVHTPAMTWQEIEWLKT